MNLLLDTHVLLWWLADDPRLASECRDAIGAADTGAFVSAASIWEIAIKCSIGRLVLDEDVELASLATSNGFSNLPVSPHHAAAVRALPLHHSDPFDRLLVVQARLERLTLATADPALSAYRVPVLPAR